MVVYYGDISIKSPRGHLRFWTFFGHILDLLKRLWTFQYAAGLRGPCILIKRPKIVDLSVPHVSQRSGYLTKHPKKVKKISKNSAFDIPNFGPFWVVKIQAGAMPPLPPDKNNPVLSHIMLTVIFSLCSQ